MGLLSENKHIFDEYGPANEYRFNPESELAVVWSQKVVTRIIPNNRRLLTLLDKNRKILEEHEYSTVEALRQHLDDLERRHFKIGPATISTRFPIGLDNIFKD